MHLTYLKRYSFVKIDVVSFSDLAKIDQVRTSRYIYDTTIDVVIHRLCTACWAMMQYFIFHSCHGGMATLYWAVEAKILSTNHERHLSSVFFFLPCLRVLRYFRSPWVPGYLMKSECWYLSFIINVVK